MKPTIAVDIDEVLSPLHDLVFTHHNEVYGTNYPVRDPGGSYYISDYTGETNDVVLQKLKKFVETEAFQNVQPLKDALRVVGWLKQRFDIVVITARQDFYYDFTHQWLAKHFPEAFTGVHFTEYVIGKGIKVPKSVLCLQTGATYIIDDNLETANECAEAGLKAILFGDYPWNQTKTLSPGVTRCTNWQEVEEYFRAEG